MPTAKGPSKPNLKSKPKRRKVVRKEGNIHVRVTEQQKAILIEAAERAGLGVSSWMLSVALREAQRG